MGVLRTRILDTAGHAEWAWELLNNGDQLNELFGQPPQPTTKCQKNATEIGSQSVLDPVSLRVYQDDQTV